MNGTPQACGIVPARVVDADCPSRLSAQLLQECKKNKLENEVMVSTRCSRHGEHPITMYLVDHSALESLPRANRSITSLVQCMSATMTRTMRWKKRTQILYEHWFYVSYVCIVQLAENGERRHEDPGRDDDEGRNTQRRHGLHAKKEKKKRPYSIQESYA